MGGTNLRSLWGTRSSRLLTLARLGGLAAFVWGVAHQLQAGAAGEHWAGPVLVAAAVVGWVGWMACRSLHAPDRIVFASLAVLAVAGGALAAYAPVAVGFLAVAAMGASIAFEPGAAVAVAALGFAALVAAVAAVGSPVHGSAGEIVAEGALAAVAGLLAGASRRQYLARALQAEELLAERVRADTERDRAAALAERNRMGREIHDVLAHSLGALSVQLDAADALLEQGEDPDRARELVRQARRLAVEGLDETRRAVHALRDDPVELTERLGVLAGREGAELRVDGRPRRLEPDVALALYRAAQEALTNARKHAPGAAVAIRLEFSADDTVLQVTNGASPDDTVPSQLARSGAGVGLQGMRERIELAGGQVRAEPKGGGWTVRVAVPA